MVRKKIVCFLVKNTVQRIAIFAFLFSITPTFSAALNWSRSSRKCPPNHLIAGADRGVFICKPTPTDVLPACASAVTDPVQAEVSVSISSKLKFDCGLEGTRLRFLKRISLDNKTAYCSLPCQVPTSSSSASSASSSSSSSSAPEPATVDFSLSHSKVKEGSATKPKLSFHRSGDTASDVTIFLNWDGVGSGYWNTTATHPNSLNTNAARDYHGKRSSIIIPAGQTDVFFELGIRDDSTDEVTERIVITATASGATFVGVTRKRVEIIDNDPVAPPCHPSGYDLGKDDIDGNLDSHEVVCKSSSNSTCAATHNPNYIENDSDSGCCSNKVHYYTGSLKGTCTGNGHCGFCGNNGGCNYDDFIVRCE